MAPLGHIHQAPPRAGGIHRGGRLRSQVKLRGFFSRKKTFKSHFTCLVSKCRKKSKKKGEEEEEEEEDQYVFGDLVGTFDCFFM